MDAIVLFFVPGKGALCRFRLEMGLVAAAQVGALRATRVFAAFAAMMPIISALLVADVSVRRPETFAG